MKNHRLWVKLFGNKTPPDRRNEWEILTKVVGVTRTNPDGTNRQSLVSMCYPGDKLTLIREPDNPVDPRAVKVCTAAGLQLGYLTRDRAHELSQDLDRGDKLDAVVERRTGGGVTEDGEEMSYGVNISIKPHSREQ